MGGLGGLRGRAWVAAWLPCLGLPRAERRQSAGLICFAQWALAFSAPTRPAALALRVRCPGLPALEHEVRKGL